MSPSFQSKFILQKCNHAGLPPRLSHPEYYAADRSAPTSRQGAVAPRLTPQSAKSVGPYRSDRPVVPHHSVHYDRRCLHLTDPSRRTIFSTTSHTVVVEFVSARPTVWWCASNSRWLSGVAWGCRRTSAAGRQSLSGWWCRPPASS